jgi:hypothetical protein
MSQIFGTNQELEKQWKKIYKARTPKRGTSELLRKLDRALGAKTYDRQAFVQNVTGNNAKNDAKRFVKGITDAISDLKQQQAKFKDWTEKERSFFAKLINELEFEQKFWMSRAK